MIQVVTEGGRHFISLMAIVRFICQRVFANRANPASKMRKGYSKVPLS